MKRAKHLLIGWVLGLAMGWVLGFLRFPYLSGQSSFGAGFVAALVSVAFLLSLWQLRNGGWPMTGQMGGTQHRFWTVAALLLGVVMGGTAMYRQKQAFKSQIANQNRQIQDLKGLVEYVQRNDATPLVNSLLEAVDKDIKKHPRRVLSDTLITRVAALSAALKTHRYMEHDTLSLREVSPERGQLLLALVLLKMDPGSFTKIKGKASFAGADLRETDLSGLDLSGIDLQGANLERANLSKTNLTGAKLNDAYLWNANLNGANLTQAELKKAELGWATLNGATLVKANLNGAHLPSAQFREADCFDASWKFAQLSGAFLNAANLISVDFVGTDFTRVNFSEANLIDTDLRKIILTEAEITGAKFDKAIVDKDWLDRVARWKPLGSQIFNENYTIVNDTFDKLKNPLYRLKVE